MLTRFYDQIKRAYDNIISGLNINMDDSWDKIRKTYETVREMINRAKQLQMSAKLLNDAIQADLSPEEIKARLADTMADIKGLILATKEALANETDPVKRAYLVKQLEDITNYAKSLQAAATEAINGNPEAKRMSKVAFNNISNASQRYNFI